MAATIMGSRVSTYAVRAAFGLFVCSAPLSVPLSGQERPRLRDWGVTVGILPTGDLNAITDVPGVRVGQVTVSQSDSINTGVTVVLPHGGNLFRRKVAGAIVVGNGFGKLTGALQVNELGELESPIVLTCTLCVGKAWDATAQYLLSLPGNEDVRSVNPVIGETNDGFLNDIRARAVTADHVLQAIRVADEGPVEEGSVGAGRGTRAFGWKGGIGTSSRRLPDELGGWTVGVLVQSNFGGVLTIAGAPVGVELDQYLLRDSITASDQAGSIMIVLATDAALDHRLLRRLGRRALLGLGRTGSPMTNGSGDFVIAFATGNEPILPNNDMTSLFLAAVEATEEAIYNSLLRASTVRGHRGTVEALPLDSTRAILRSYGVISD